MLDLLAVSVVTIATSADTPVKTQPPHLDATTSIDIVDPAIVAPYPSISHPVATCPPGEFASAFSEDLFSISGEYGGRQQASDGLIYAIAFYGLHHYF